MPTFFLTRRGRLEAGLAPLTIRGRGRCNEASVPTPVSLAPQPPAVLGGSRGRDSRGLKATVPHVWELGLPSDCVVQEGQGCGRRSPPAWAWAQVRTAAAAPLPQRKGSS